MRALIVLSASLLVFAAACSGSGTAKDVTASLRIDVWPDGQGPEKSEQHWRLHCNPLGGNLPHGDRACYKLALISRPFAPVARTAVCSQVYGGPQLAHVQGRIRGRSVATTFSRTDGCQIARWDRVDFLFPGAK